jgi:PhoPQ-activated pathogenicity-related protein
MTLRVLLCSCLLLLAVGGVDRVTADEPRSSTEKSVAVTDANTGPTALDRYIAAKDDSYQWELITQRRDVGSTVSVLKLVSQNWRTPGDVDRTEWSHWLTIVKPDQASTDTAMLFISGGAVGSDPPSSASRETVMVAGATQVIVAELKMVPSQPLVFHGDGQGRKEDDLIGYSWDQYLKTGDETWPAQLPMTKSAVRGMDAAQEFLRSEAGGETEIDRFVVAGASKRGWTTWLTGAVDPRVVAIAPIVIDVLNVNVSMQHHYAAYGFWAPSIGDYVHHEIPNRRFFPEYKQLMQIVDPFAYRNRLTMPKCLISATGDQFFLPDSSRFYFDQLVGEKHLCYVPNADHSLRNSTAVDTLASFLYCIANRIERPELQWQYPDAGTVQVTPSTEPERVVLWQASNAKTRDFRVESIGTAYSDTELTADKDGNYRVTVDQPDAGWTAYFVEFTFDVGAPTPMRFTTPVRVIPDTLPFADKQAPLYEAN